MFPAPVYVARVTHHLLYPLRARPHDLIFIWPGAGDLTIIVTDASGKKILASRDMQFGELDGCTMKLEDEGMVSPWLFVREPVLALQVSLRRPA